MARERPLPRVAVLGAGPAGIGAAFQLRRRGVAEVTVIERQPVVGGNAGSFTAWGQRLDYGSHRLHPACDPAILADLRQLLGDDLLDRPRHGRIRLRGRWLHFPLQPLDILRRADRRFAAGTVRDMLVRRTGSAGVAGVSFASVLRGSLGPTICDHFYFPYARKIWGVEPDGLSAIQARRRVSAGSFGKLVRKVFAQVPGLRRPGAGRFYYPRRGYGQLGETMAADAQRLGARLVLGHRVTAIELPGTGSPRGVVCAEDEAGATMRVEADYVWSTLPMALLPRIVRPAPPESVVEAAQRMQFRAMILVYVRVPVDRFTEYDAHYFPEEGIRMTRLSEPKNYSASSEPRGQTVLCAELPCGVGDALWSASDDELGAIVADDLDRAGIPLPATATGVLSKRLSHAYPIYLQGYEQHFDALDAWAGGLPRFLSFGRQGLFAHDNTHHALAMAYAAVDCLSDGGFDDRRWQRYRMQFTSHVVED